MSRRKAVLEGVLTPNRQTCVKWLIDDNIIVTLSVVHLWQAI